MARGRQRRWWREDGQSGRLGARYRPRQQWLLARGGTEIKREQAKKRSTVNRSVITIVTVNVASPTLRFRWRSSSDEEEYRIGGRCARGIRT